MAKDIRRKEQFSGKWILAREIEKTQGVIKSAFSMCVCVCVCVCVGVGLHVQYALLVWPLPVDARWFEPLCFVRCLTPHLYPS